MNILVVEDDRRIASFLERGLAAEGYHVSVERDGRDGLERIRADSFDLVILDRMLPYIDGMEVCRVIREENLPTLILMLTAKDSLQDKIEGLKGGADDYISKPFAFDELLARIVALRRRGGTEQPKLLRAGDIVLDAAAHRVSKAGTPLQLTLKEFELLAYLMVNADKVVSRQRLLSSVWDYGYDPGTKIVDVYIRYLRKKIDSADAPSLIQTIRGVGYMMTRQ
ncbi:response regulator transcription factor [Devosia sp. 2618]|uniref:response regulator transcription factor n=1 Tax=Devosia sp. 2618 TaxID=3156454 RepID=UPI003394D6DC